ncbi:hypothetical protein INR49_025236 [Caranx melampygus]|nr:hypothetical protein INR49_025236 [Caranx melampygus]
MEKQVYVGRESRCLTPWQIALHSGASMPDKKVSEQMGQISRDNDELLHRKSNERGEDFEKERKRGEDFEKERKKTKSGKRGVVGVWGVGQGGGGGAGRGIEARAPQAHLPMPHFPLCGIHVARGANTEPPIVLLMPILSPVQLQPKKPQTTSCGVDVSQTQSWRFGRGPHPAVGSDGIQAPQDTRLPTHRLVFPITGITPEPKRHFESGSGR